MDRASFAKSLLGRHVEPILIAFLLTLFLALSAHRLHDPGFPYDGVVEIKALKIAEIMGQKSLWTMLREGDLAVNLYHGTMTAHFLAPFVYFFGPNWTLARFFPVFFGLLALLFVYLFARDYFGRTAAMAALFLLVIHPPWLMGIKIGHRFESESITYGMAALLCLGWWWKSRRPVFLGLGTFWLGWGLGSRLYFVWFLNAVVLLGIVMGREIVRRWSGGELVKMAAWGLGGFLAGAFFLMQGMAKSTPGFLIGELLDPDNPNGILHYAANFWAVLDLFHSMLDGSRFMELQFAEKHGNFLYPWFFWLSMAGYFVLRPKGTWGAVILFFGMLLQTPIYRSGYKTNTDAFFWLYPLPQLIMGIVWAELLRRAEKRLPARAFVWGLMVFVAAAEIQSLGKYLSLLRDTGGRHEYSGAIYDLAAWLDNKNPRMAYSFDQETVTYLKFIVPRLRYKISWVGPVPEDNKFLTQADERFEEALSSRAKLMDERDPANVYYIHHAYSTLPFYPVVIKKLCDAKGKELRLEKEFFNASGALSFQVYSVWAKSRKDAWKTGFRRGQDFQRGLIAGRPARGRFSAACPFDPFEKGAEDHFPPGFMLVFDEVSEGAPEAPRPEKIVGQIEDGEAEEVVEPQPRVGEVPGEGPGPADIHVREMVEVIVGEVDFSLPEELFVKFRSGVGGEHADRRVMGAHPAQFDQEPERLPYLPVVLLREADDDVDLHVDARFEGSFEGIPHLGKADSLFDPAQRILRAAFRGIIEVAASGTIEPS